jgi:hypothetical protein
MFGEAPQQKAEILGGAGRFLVAWEGASRQSLG